MLDIFQYSFMARAFIAGIAIAVMAPLIGNFLVMRRYSLIADTLAHIALAGVAIGLFIGIYPLFTAVIVAVISAVAIEKLRSNRKISGETVLAMFLPAGLSLALILINLSKGLNINIFSYLFGSISTVAPQDLRLIIVLGAGTLAAVGIFYKQLLYVCFDQEGAKISGIRVGLINGVLMALTAIIVSLAIRVVGALLIGALMVIPVVTATNISKSFKKNILFSICFALLSVITGLYFSYYLDLPAGAAIVLTSLIIFGITTLATKKI